MTKGMPAPTESIVVSSVTTIAALIPGTAATNLGKAEDAVHASGDTGVFALAVQKATPANLAGADGDYDALEVSGGRLWVSGVVTDIVPGTAATNLGKAEDAAHVSGDTGVMALGVENTANTALSGGAGDYTPLGVDAEGSLRIIGNRAHDAIDSGAPIKIGGVAESTTPTAVADADRVAAWFDTLGRLIVDTKIRGVTGTVTRDTSTTTYTAGDVVSNSTAVSHTNITFSNIALLNGGGGFVASAVLINNESVATKPDLELWLFDTNPTLMEDNAAFDPTDAEMLRLWMVIKFPTANFVVGLASGNSYCNGVIESNSAKQGFVCASGDTALYGVLVVRNAYVPVASEVFTIRLTIAGS